MIETAEAPTNHHCTMTGNLHHPVTSLAQLSTSLLPLLFGGNGDDGNGVDSCYNYSSSSSTPSTSPTDSIPIGIPIISLLQRIQQFLSSIDLSFTIPENDNTTTNNAWAGKYEVVLPNISTLLGVQFGFMMAVVIGMVMATILYYTIIIIPTRNDDDDIGVNATKNDDTKKKRINNVMSTPNKTILGTTLLITTIYAPYLLINTLAVQHTSIRFVICCCFVLYLFRTLEALFGFVPLGATSSLGVYCTYFSLPFDMEFDTTTTSNNSSSSSLKQQPQPVKATTHDIWNGIRNMIKSVTYICILCSILSKYGYVPFGETNVGEFYEPIVVGDYLNGRHLGNCFAIALLFQQALATGDAVIGNAIQIFLGYKVKQSMRNPMLEATSPSDFWGRRWNLLVHSVMKRGVYKPVRKISCSPILASLAVFIASGLFHEWLVHAVLLYQRPSSSSSSNVLLGSNTAFFLWNFVVIVCEKLFLQTKMISSFGKRYLPSIVVPFCIIMTSLPVAHWFGNPYLKGGYFMDYEQCLILIRKV
eukprot:CAMPEP_0183704296 /NCGR_PEP_ID=MMETSP0737-20130205/1667_1 /TAXON_ID=385413 /ORGANISM="Thalassiosira miniscula, Strain CCMP1093" /LENGTH=530 /DNA_ID=CAMNT_0025931133 /DNA_START=143 /DNA_END=1735 /DNA_ORIENTATION=+